VTKIVVSELVLDVCNQVRVLAMQVALAVESQQRRVTPEDREDNVVQ
jgi:hypothetical protein